MGRIEAVCLSEKRGEKKKNVGSAALIENFGFENDAHAGDWHRQVSLLAAEDVDAFREKGAQVGPGDFGENLLVRGINFKALQVGSRLTATGALLEVTQIGKECHARCAIYDQVGDCIMPKSGVFARVLRGGTVSVGDTIKLLGTKYRAAVITASDKGFAGERKDESGSVLKELLEDAGYTIEAYSILPDELDVLSDEMKRLCDGDICDVIFTTGGTGLSPRDVTPEATLAIAHRLVPGIPEAMRAASMQKTSRAMLSRGVSAIRGRTLIVNLPGSPKAVAECLEVILDTLGHGLEVLRGITGDCAR
jgi:molybdenum cofactor synthesis domain-containing protein